MYFFLGKTNSGFYGLTTLYIKKNGHPHDEGSKQVKIRESMYSTRKKLNKISIILYLDNKNLLSDNG